MGRVISSLDRARRQGHCHALLESPTGTGKSLSLLCSVLAWHQQLRHRLIVETPDPSMYTPTPTPTPTPTAIPAPVPTPDPLVHGGGFIPEPEPSRNPEQTPKATGNGVKRKLVVPTIYYASRTHSQITQVIREYRKTAYRVPMAVLASRKHYCTNKYVCMKENVDEECKLLLKDTGPGCPEFKNAHKVKNHPSLQKGGCHEVHDIEDLVKVGRTVKGCSYFAAQTMAEEAQLVFCPYSYILNPIVRRAMDIDIKGSIVILDEAHNIEDMSREAGSLDVDEETLYTLQTELGQLCTVESVAAIYQPLYDTIQGIVSWMGDRRNNLKKHEFEHYSSYWTGDKAIRELQLAGITQQCFPILQECATKAIKAASDAESDGVNLSGISAITLEGLFSSLGYFFSENGCHALDYQLAVQRFVKRDGSSAASGWSCTLSLWCLNPAVVFKEIANLSLSVILTSGTLSPMSSFASELGVQFEACMEAPHVIDVESQLWSAVISSGPGNCQLNASYKTADGLSFQDALGASLEEICKIVPGGALVFFPSYKLLEKLRVRWCQTGQWSRLNAQKSIFVEPRGKMDDFELVLKGYYDSIQGNNKVANGKLRRGLKRVHKHPSSEESSQNPEKRGAAFLAVCRGKVSEGIDFSDENARVVVIVGIPFPNKNDIQLVLKKNYNDTFKSSKGLLSGSEWYCHQAFRALNQAAGRCIRHRFDYGAIILLDERFKEERNLTYISKWLRKSIKQYNSFDESLEGLRAFFLDAEKRSSHKHKDALETELLISDANKEDLPSSKQNFLNQQILQKINQKQKKLNFPNRRKLIPENVIAQQKDQMPKASGPVTKDASRAGLKTRCNINAKATVETNKKPLNHYEEWLETSCMESGTNTSDQSMIIKNTLQEKDLFMEVAQTCNQFSESSPRTTTVSRGNLSENACTLAGSPERVESSINTLDQSLVIKSTMEDGDLYSIEVQTCNQFSVRSGSPPTIISNGNFSQRVCTSTGSPERVEPSINTLDQSLVIKSTIEDENLYSKLVQTCTRFSDRSSFSLPTTISKRNLSDCACTSTGSPETMPVEPFGSELESSLSMSVNSHQKKRKLLDSQLNNCTQMDHFSTLDSVSCCRVDSASGSCISRDTEQRTESPLPNNCARCRLQTPMKGTIMKNNQSTLPLSVDFSNEKKLHISCSFCKNPLGLRENNFLSTCSLVPLSKVYLSYVLEYGPTNSLSSEDLSRMPRKNTRAVISDVSLIDQRILNKCIREGALQHDTWSEEDGCVFRIVACPFCNDHKTFLGLRVMASDASNVHLLNKVLFYADHLDIRNEQPPKEVINSTCANVIGRGSGLVDIEKYAYSPCPKDSEFLTKTKSKLKLSKR